MEKTLNITTLLLAIVFIFPAIDAGAYAYESEIDFSVGLVIPYPRVSLGTNFFRASKDDEFREQKLCENALGEIMLLNERLERNELGLEVEIYDCKLSLNVSVRDVINPEDRGKYAIAIKMELVPTTANLNLYTYRTQREICLSARDMTEDNIVPPYEKLVGLGGGVNSHMRRVMVAVGFEPMKLHDLEVASRFENNFRLNGCTYGSFIRGTYVGAPNTN